jgi:hypothetical protein
MYNSETKAPIPHDATGFTSIIRDIEAGDEMVLLTNLRDQTYMPCRSGKKLDKSVPFRWARRGVRGHVLETMRTPTGIVTTKSAFWRFMAKLNGDNGTESEATSLAALPLSTYRRTQIEEARQELEQSGI